MSYQEVGLKRWKRRAVEQMFKPLEEIEIREVRRQEGQPINGFRCLSAINIILYTKLRSRKLAPLEKLKCASPLLIEAYL